ncbi:hypothetical protein R1sor_005903 [Riccia sorocarpa]|uniref:Uncharacterized protein n=1 Tax=Riccia sorocarpa TaxID=122646 RepID=A0ABD3HL50_9MARC
MATNEDHITVPINVNLMLKSVFYMQIVLILSLWTLIVAEWHAFVFAREVAMDARIQACDYLVDSGVPESQPMDYSLCPRTQTFFREPIHVFVNRVVPLAPSVLPRRPIPAPAARSVPLQLNFINDPLLPSRLQLGRTSPIPGRTEPLPEGSGTDAEHADFIEEEPEPVVTAEQDADDSAARADEGNSSGRVYWHDWKTLLLIQVKKDELLASGRQTARAKFDRNESIEWEKAEKGVVMKAWQFKNKYGNLLFDHRKVRDWKGRTGKPSYWDMSASEKKEERLPAKMLVEWYELLDSTQGIRPVNSPVCLEIPPHILSPMRAQVLEHLQHRWIHLFPG